MRFVRHVLQMARFGKACVLIWDNSCVGFLHSSVEEIADGRVGSARRVVHPHLGIGYRIVCDG